MSYELHHEIRVDKLIELLQQIPADHSVHPNQVENLTIYNAEGIYAGYVELGPGQRVELFANRADA